MTRPAKPIGLHIMEGNPNGLTKADISDRLENEIRFGGYTFTASRRIKKNKVALAKWREIINLYNGMDFVSTADSDAIEMYCITWSEIQSLDDARNDIILRGTREKWDKIKIQVAIDKSNLDYRKDKKCELLLKLSDRLFLNSAARIKNIAKSSRKAQEDPNKEMFGD